MARIAGVDLPKDKKIEIALTYIYGIGPTSAKNHAPIKRNINPTTEIKAPIKICSGP